MQGELGDLKARLERHTNHPVFLASTVHITLGRRNGNTGHLAVSRIHKVHRLAVVFGDHLVKTRGGAKRLAVHADQDVALCESRALGVKARDDTGNLHFGFLSPPQKTDALFFVVDGRDSEVQPVAVPLYPNIERPARACDFLHRDVFPRRVGNVFDLNDLVAFPDAALGRCTVRNHVANYRIGWCRNLRITGHKQPGEKHHSQHDVDRGTGQCDDQTLPARLRE